MKTVKIGPVDPEILNEICNFLAVSNQTFTNELCQLWSYWTEFDEIFTQYTGIICAASMHIQVALSHCVSECQCNESWEFAICLQNWLP